MTLTPSHPSERHAGPSPTRFHARPRVLITDGDSVGVIAMVRGLAQAGYAPWVAASRRSAPAARSALAHGAAIVTDPAASARDFTEEVAALIDAVDPVAVLPGGEPGLLALADLAEGTADPRLAVCRQSVVRRATDKTALPELAGRAGLAVPETMALSAREAARHGLPYELPVCVKPLRSRIPVGGGLRPCVVRVARTRAEVIDALTRLPGGRGLLQRHHRGELYGVGGIVWDGEIVAAVHQRARRTFPPGCGEMAYAVAVSRDAALEERIVRLLVELGWRGLFQMQFLETDARRLLIDLNPRVYGSLALALAARQNLPGIWVDLLRGRPVVPVPYEPGVSFRNEFLDARALLAAARRGSWRAVARAAAARADAHAFYAAGDPLPLLALAPALAPRIGSKAQLPIRSRPRRRRARPG